MKIILLWPEDNAEPLGCSCGALQRAHTGKIRHLCGHGCVLAHVPQGYLVHHSCSCLLPHQEDKVEAVNFHISWPVTFSSWRCHGGEENRKTVTAVWVSLEGFLSWNDLPMANCSNSACFTRAHLQMSHSMRCAMPFWDRGVGQG